MSFTQVTPAPARLNRSTLAVPGSQTKFFEKAAKSLADVIFLDLEDAVSADQKANARKTVVEALRDLDWGRKTLSVRINGLDTHHAYRDIIDLVEQSGERLDLILVPKIGTAADVYAVDMLLTQAETAVGRKKRIGLELQIETALGLQNIHEIAGASKRIESLHFGSGDFAASTGARNTSIGGSNPDYAILTDKDPEGNRATHWQDMWHYALARLVVAARANGLRPVDGPYGDFQDAEGMRVAAKRSAALGFAGKMVIHPSQIAIANECFSPPPQEVEKARRILAAMEEGRLKGQGAVALDGKLLDIASIRQAEVLVKTAAMIEEAGS